MEPYECLSSRRTFLQLGTVATAGSIMSHLQADEKKTGWIDAHVHVWTSDTKRYPLDKRFSVSDMKPSSFTPDELMAHTRPLGIERIVLIQMSFYRFDNAYMLDTIEKYPGVFSGVAIVDHQLPDVATTMKELSRRGVRGFRIATRGPQTETWLDDPGMERLWQAATHQGLAVCPLINPADLPIVDQLCQRFPDAKVVVDHFARVGMGGFHQDHLDALCRLSRHANVYVKTSAFYAVGGPPPYTDALPMLRRVIETFGTQRLMWASDAPFQVQSPHRYEPALAIVRDQLSELSRNDRDWILGKTAEKVFFS